MKKKKLLGINFLCDVASTLAFLMLWNIAVQGELDKMLPGPTSVLEKFFTSLVSGKIDQNTLMEYTFCSLLRAMVGYALGSIAGVILGLAMSTYKMMKTICSLPFRIVRPIPPITWISISIIWIGLGEDVRIFLILLTSFCYVILNTQNGAKSMDQQLVDAAHMLGAKDHQVFTTIILPACVSSTLADLQVVLPSNWTTVLTTEMVHSSNSLGQVIIIGMNSGGILQIPVGIMAIGIVGPVPPTTFRKVGAVLYRWNKNGT